MSNKAAVYTYAESGESSSWIEKVSTSFLKNRINRDLKAATKVHPCIINNHRVLVHEHGLREKNPTAYEQLKIYAENNAFAIKEDQRTKDSKPANFERRLAKSLPMLFLASGIFMSGSAAAGGITAPDVDIKVMSDVEVTGEYDTSDRAYSQEDGKRFITNPYGETESILAVAAETKAKGKLKRVSTRGIKMPSGYVGGFINKYENTFANGETFSYYEGDGFGALGYHAGDGTVVLDVLVGGGAFSSPKLWGPYDQLLGDKDNSSMQLMMGDGSKDGMGLLKASYAIGYTAVLAEEDYSSLGNAYGTAINETVKNMIASDDAPDKNVASVADTSDDKS